MWRNSEKDLLIKQRALSVLILSGSWRLARPWSIWPIACVEFSSARADTQPAREKLSAVTNTCFSFPNGK